MSHTLITFLGKGPRGEGGYRQACYRFDSGNSYMTPYFGIALLQELAASGDPADHLVVLGTGSSIWDALIYEEIKEDDLWLKLSERVETGAVDDGLLEQVSPLVEQSFSSRGLASRVTLATIPFGRDQKEQVNILRKMADIVEPEGVVTMDVSHGFRSLPMLGLVSALFLTRLKKVTIGGIYYGALEMTEHGMTPVIRLDGLLHIAQWLNAMSGFLKSGDYGIFAPLLGDRAATDALRQAAFFEKTINIQQVRGNLKKARQSFETLKAKDPVFSLFADELLDLTSWVEKQRFAGRQLAAARNALRARNYVRAAALAEESMISDQVARDGGNPDRYWDRESARKTLNEATRGVCHGAPEVPARIYAELRALRNCLVHGIPPGKNSFGQQKTLSSEDNLFVRLDELIEKAERIINQAS